MNTEGKSEAYVNFGKMKYRDVELRKYDSHIVHS